MVVVVVDGFGRNAEDRAIAMGAMGMDGWMEGWRENEFARSRESRSRVQITPMWTNRPDGRRRPRSRRRLSAR